MGGFVTFTTQSFSGSIGTDGDGNIEIKTMGNQKQIIFDGRKVISGSKEYWKDDKGDLDTKSAFGKEDIERLRDGKPLKDKDGIRVAARLTKGSIITGSLVVSGSSSTTGSWEMSGSGGVTGSWDVSGSFGGDGTGSWTGSWDTSGSWNGEGDGQWTGSWDVSGSFGGEGTGSWTGSWEVSGSGTFVVIGPSVTSGSTIYEINTFDDGDSTPSVKNGSLFKTKNAKNLSITAFDDGVSGQQITILIEDGNTDFTHDGKGKITNGLKLNRAIDWTAGAANDTITFVYNGSKWIETNRSDNS